jgi:beta-galactosidase/beta-glucuronidase
VFVVFREPITTNSQVVPSLKSQTVAELSGPWQVAFQPNRGAPASATFDSLTDFRDNADPGIRYFSGVATYTKEVQLPAQKPGANGQLWLDLGQVNNLAEVWVNGKLAGTAWKPPYRVDISKSVVDGINHIEIKSVNLWVNRLIGDAQPGVTEKITLTTRAFYKADSPLKPSGLMGPVKVIQYSTN